MEEEEAEAEAVEEVVEEAWGSHPTAWMTRWSALFMSMSVWFMGGREKKAC